MTERQFKVGDRVRHAILGTGTVTRNSGDKIYVLFDGDVLSTLCGTAALQPIEPKPAREKLGEFWYIRRVKPNGEVTYWSTNMECWCESFDLDVKCPNRELLYGDFGVRLKVCGRNKLSFHHVTRYRKAKPTTPPVGATPDIYANGVRMTLSGELKEVQEAIDAWQTRRGVTWIDTISVIRKIVGQADTIIIDDPPKPPLDADAIRKEERERVFRSLEEKGLFYASARVRAGL